MKTVYLSISRRLLASSTLGVLALFVCGCGAGSANIPADLPAPKPLSGAGSKSAEEEAKAQGLKAPTAPAKLPRTFNPTNPTP